MSEDRVVRIGLLVVAQCLNIVGAILLVIVDWRLFVAVTAVAWAQNITEKVRRMRENGGRA